MAILISTRQESINMYEVYYNPTDKTYKFEYSYTISDLSFTDKFEIELSRDEFLWKFTFNFKAVDNLLGLTIYEYGLDNTRLKATEYNGEEEYTISPDCLYVVIEEKLNDNKGHEYYNRAVIHNSEIDKYYSYPLKILNDYDFGYKTLLINKY